MAVVQNVGNQQKVSKGKTAKKVVISQAVSSNSTNDTGDNLDKTSTFQYAKLTPQAKQCMQQHYVGYEYALCLYNNKDMDSAIGYLKSYNVTNQSVEATDLLQRIDQPLTYIINNANQRTNEWLNRETKLGAFMLTPPTLPEKNSTVLTLTKKEFETSENFNQRVVLAQQEAANKDSKVEKKYQTQLSTYNRALTGYNAKIEQEAQKRQQDSLDVYLDFVNENIPNVLGVPYFTNPIYDADQQQMFVELISDKSNFRQSIAISVPFENAENFKNNIAKVFPALEFDSTRALLTPTNIGAELGGKVYPGQFLNNNKRAVSLHDGVTADVISQY